MITIEESGLTEEQYNDLKIANLHPQHSVVAHRWNLDFSNWVTLTSLSEDPLYYWDYDYVVHPYSGDNYIWRVYKQVWKHSVPAGVSTYYMFQIRVSDGAILPSGTYQTSPAGLPTGSDKNSRYRLASDGSNLILFAATQNGIYRCASSDNGSTWGSWTQILSLAGGTRKSADRFFNDTRQASNTSLYEWTDYSADRAFDDLKDTQWRTENGITTGWLRHRTFNSNFGNDGEVLNRYAITAPPGAGPKSWTFEGAFDDPPTLWNTLDTQTNVTNWSADEERREYAFTNASDYPWYRINVTANQGSNWLSIHEFEAYYDEAYNAVDDLIAPRHDRLIFTVYDTTSETYRLNKLIDNGTSWDRYESDVRLTFRPDGLTAASLPRDTDFGHVPSGIDDYIDVVVLSTEVPGFPRTIFEDNEAVRKMQSQHGMIAFTVTGNNESADDGYTWSEYAEIDLIENYDDNNYRKTPKLSLINGTLFLTAVASNGVDNLADTGIRYYTSKDGINWSLGEYLPLTDTTMFGEGAELMYLGDYIYAGSLDRIHRSYSTLLTGHTPTAIQLDLTPYILSYGTQDSQLLSANLTLSNEAGTFNNHTWFNQDNVIALIHRAGYEINPNLISNANYERWSTSTNLVVWAETLNGTSTINQESTEVYGGKYSVRFDIDASNNSAKITQGGLSGVQAGDEVELTVWAKASAAGATFKWGLAATDQDTGIALTQAWQKFVLTGTAPSDTPLFYIESDSGCASKSLYFDNTEVRNLDASPTLHDYQQAITEVDAMHWDNQLPDRTLELATRDHLGWMMDKARAENPRYWNSLRMRGDTYLDKTGTNYGGLAHTARQKGTLKTIDGTLQIIDSGSSRGIGFVSNPADMWNGVIEGKFRCDTSSARVGLVFWALDRDELWYARYETFDDKIHLGKTNPSDVTGTDVTTSAALSWTTDIDTNWKYMRVRFRFGQVDVYTSTDGATWTNRISYTVKVEDRYYGSPYLKESSIARFERGYVGIEGWSTSSKNAEFDYVKVNELGHLHTVENAFRAYAAAAGIHDVEFEDIPYEHGTSSDWTVDANLTVTWTPLSAYTEDGYFSLQSDTSWRTMITNNDPIGRNVVIEAEMAANRGFGFVVRALDDNTHLLIGVDTDDSILVQSWNGSSYSTVYKTDVTLPHYPLYIKVAFQELRPSSDNDTIWHSLSMWANNQLVAHYMEDYGTTPISGGINWGLASKSTNVIPFYQLRLPELNSIAEAASLDPNEPPASALQRVIDGLHLKYFVRYNGQLKAWRPKAVNSAKAFTDLDDVQNARSETFDRRALRTVIRVTGGYAEATYHDPNLIPKHESRFVEVNNPYLLTSDECYAEAQRVSQRMHEAAIQTDFESSFAPFLEPEDHISLPEGERLITSILLNYMAPEIEQSISSRYYPYG